METDCVVIIYVGIGEKSTAANRKKRNTVLQLFDIEENEYLHWHKGHYYHEKGHNILDERRELC